VGGGENYFQLSLSFQKEEKVGIILTRKKKGWGRRRMGE